MGVCWLTVGGKSWWWKIHSLVVFGDKEVVRRDGFVAINGEEESVRAYQRLFTSSNPQRPFSLFPVCLFLLCVFAPAA